MKKILEKWKKLTTILSGSVGVVSCDYRSWLRPLCTQSPHSPPSHSTQGLLWPLCTTTCCHAGLFTLIAQSEDERGEVLSLGLPTSPSFCVGRYWTQWLCQVSTYFFSLSSNSYPALKTPSLLRTVFLAMTPQSGMWMRMEIPAYRSISAPQNLTRFHCLPQGFATKFSVVKGETVQFKIKTDSSNYRLDIFRVGWYGTIKNCYQD